MRSAGYDLTPVWQLASRPLVLHLKEIFRAYEIDCVFDVGANQGQYYDLLRTEVGFRGTVLSFEPVRKYVDLLESRAKTESDWTIFDFALGSKNETQSINVTKSPGLNSFLVPKDENQVAKIEAVEIKTLDSIFEDLRKRYGFRAPYLKLDTQGLDLEVLKGAHESIRHYHALQTEASLRPIYEDMPGYKESLDRFLAAGFEVTGMFAVWRDEALRLVEFDCVMASKVLADSLERSNPIAVA